MSSGTLIITSNISEERFIESCLNYAAQGFDINYISLGFCFYAMGKNWNVYKVTHYLKLLSEISKKENCEGLEE